MAQVSVGRVENLEDLVRGLSSVCGALESACVQQVLIAEQQCEITCEKVQESSRMLERASQREQKAQQRIENAQYELASAWRTHAAAQSSLSSCLAMPSGNSCYSTCSAEYAAVSNAESAVEQAQNMLERADSKLELAIANRISMEQRLELMKQAQVMAEHALEHVRQACAVRWAAVCQLFDRSVARLRDAQRALDAYLSANSSAAEFHAWRTWRPAQTGSPVTPDVLRDRMNLSPEQQRLFQEYLYDRDPAYRKQVDKYRSQWVAANGDAERNIIARRARTHLSGEFGEQLARYALEPIGGRIETQGRTFVGDDGRYTKTDLLVRDLQVPVVLGRGEGMSAPVGGSMAFEVKCGKAEYLYAQKDHMVFQAEGHKQADAQCTLCSRDIHDLPLDKEKELRDAMHDAGSPMVGMLPSKNEIDQSCLDFIRQNKGG